MFLTSKDCWGGTFSLLNGREVEFETLQCFCFPDVQKVTALSKPNSTFK